MDGSRRSSNQDRGAARGHGLADPDLCEDRATRTSNDVKLAVAAGADVVVVDGMQGGTAATQDVFIEHAGIPTLPAVRLAAEALREIGKQDEVQLIVSGASDRERISPRPWRSARTPSRSARPP